MFELSQNRSKVNIYLKKQKKILIIEDEKDLRTILKRILSENQYTVNAACDGREGIDKNRKMKPDCVILDFKLPDTDGIKVIYRIRSYNKTAKIILITAYGTKEIREELLKLGVSDFIEKPFRIEKILKALKKAMSHNIGAYPPLSSPSKQ